MKCAWPAGLLLTLLFGVIPAWGCRRSAGSKTWRCAGDSWMDWKTTDPARLNSVGAYFRSALAHNDNAAFGVPKSPMAIAGLKITKVFPDSVGMAVGFSVLVEAPFDVARRTFEEELGKPLGQCETSDGMRSCGLPIAEQRTVMLMSADPPNDKTTLVGCYYLYEK